MKQKDFLNYLDQRIDGKITEYDVSLDWDSRNHSVEIILELFAENLSGVAIDDSEGTTSEEDVIDFEDGILLVHPEKSLYEAENYLAVIPYDAKKGFSKGFINGLVDYVKEILEDGMSDLLDFLDEDSDAEVFELHWDNHDLQEKVDEYADELDEYLPYPKY